MTYKEATGKPKVLIVGAGIGGFMQAILLEEINIPYRIFEQRALEIRPLDTQQLLKCETRSAMAFCGITFPALEQVGLYEVLCKVPKPYENSDFLF
ncbi:hypothetical protein BGZ76_001231 [Entomortierella beljakovae]|nr:hypothetical protein BGZ76_001231 [Entomortierella beljakovae]